MQPDVSAYMGAWYVWGAIFVVHVSHDLHRDLDHH